MATLHSSSSASLFVGNLDSSVTQGDLYKAFSDFKSLASVGLCKDSCSGSSYGFANFLSREDAILARDKKHHTRLNGKIIRVMLAPDADVGKYMKKSDLAKHKKALLHTRSPSSETVIIGGFLLLLYAGLYSCVDSHTRLLIAKQEVEKATNFDERANLTISTSFLVFIAVFISYYAISKRRYRMRLILDECAVVIGSVGFVISSIMMQKGFIKWVCSSFGIGIGLWRLVSLTIKLWKVRSGRLPKNEDPEYNAGGHQSETNDIQTRSELLEMLGEGDTKGSAKGGDANAKKDGQSSQNGQFSQLAHQGSFSQGPYANSQAQQHMMVPMPGTD